MNLQTVYDASADRLIELAAKNTFIAITARFATEQDANIVLTGGRTGAKIAAALATEISDAATNFPEQFLKRKIHIWFSDERFVSANNPDRTDLVILTELEKCKDHLEIHRVASASDDLNSERIKSELIVAARSYDEELGSSLTGSGFDSVILSLGEDGHVASLFPGQGEVLNSKGFAAPVNASPKPPPNRVTLTLHTLSNSAQIFVFGIGAGKLEPVKAVQAEDARAVVTKLRQNSTRGHMFLLTDQKDK
jgi:6-phosphogluconolactonase